MINANKLTVLDLGRRGTYGDVVYGFSMNGYEDCTATVLHQRYCDDEPYACTGVEIEDGYVLWTVSNVDTYIDPDDADYDKVTGQLEVQFYKDGLLVKSAIWKTVVYNSLGDASETVPDAYQSWVDNIAQKSATAVAASASATASAASAALSATNAAASETNAANSATSSANSATASSNYATSSSKAMTSALQYASNAEKSSASAANASRSAINGATSASLHADRAEAAQTSAETAAQTATEIAESAEQSAESAQSAQTASESARDAAVTAQNAAEKAASEAAQDYSIEKARAEAAESALSTAITDEVSRAKAAEATKANASDLAAEAETRKSADDAISDTIGDDPATDDKWQEVADLIEEANSGYSSLVDLCIDLPQESAGESINGKLTAGNDILKDILLELEGGMRYVNYQ